MVNSPEAKYLSPKERFQEKIKETQERVPWIRSILKVFYKPIVSFDPEKELSKIKEEIKKVPEEKQSQFRREKIEDFKLKLIWQRLHLSRIQNKLEDFIVKNPDASEKQILAHVAKDIKGAKLDFVQRAKILSAVYTYVGRHGTIKRYLKVFQEKYPPFGDKEGETNIRWQKELFKAIFEFYPRGKIELVLRPMVLFWRCHDIEDFAQAFGCSIEEAKKMGGARISRRFGIPDLQKMITLENASEYSEKQSLEVLTHEERHAIKDLIPEIKLPEKKFFIEYLSGKISMEDLQAAISRDAGKNMHFYRIKAKGEILAALKEGKSPDTIRSYLLKEGGSYDWPKKYKLVEDLEKRVKETCPTCAKVRPMIEVIIRNQKKQYQNIIFLALGAVKDLEHIFSRREIVSLLSQEPIEKWPRVIRLIEETLDLK